MCVCVCVPNFPDGSFQTEAGIAEELSSLKTCLGIHKVDNVHLQVPFPPFNKTIPVQPNLLTTPTSKSKTAVVVEGTRHTLSDSIETETLCKSSEEIKLDSNVVKGGNSSSFVSPVSSVSVSSVDWNTLAKQLITVLEKAIHSRIVRAPYLPSCRVVARDVNSIDLEHRSHEEEVAGCQNQTLVLEPKTEYIHGRARIAILFSGGVDSMLLAAIVDR